MVASFVIDTLLDRRAILADGGRTNRCTSFDAYDRHALEQFRCFIIVLLREIEVVCQFDTYIKVSQLICVRFRSG